MNDWMEIKSQEDANGLMKIFGGFHDSCIREAHIWTEHYVGKDLSMGIGVGLDTRARFLFQRQYTNPSAIELLFEEVIRFSLNPSPENYDSIIYGATLIIKDGVIYWCDSADWNVTDKDDEDVTWISARKLSWRRSDHWMGDELRYGPR